jgi:hypothetical protein
MRIFIDAGHQLGVDPGAVGQVVEVEHNIAIREAMIKYISFISVPSNTTLNERIKWINQNATKDDLLISIHTNAGGGNGVETWFYGGYDPAKDKADLLTKLVTEKIGEPARQSKPDTESRFGKFGIIRLTKPYAFLIECGFVDSPDQNDCIPEKTDGYAKGIAEFCSQLAGVPLKSVTTKVDIQVQNPTESIQAIKAALTEPKYLFNQNLYPGLTGNAEVIQLQYYLQAKGYFPKTTLITGNYLEITKKAVANFQVQNKIVATLNSYGAGYFGPKSREFINNN